MANNPIGSTELHSANITTASTITRPVTITGGNTVGSVLTATLGAGWAAATYQWTRAGSDISGATTSTYTITSSDASTLLACRVSGLSNSADGITIAEETAYLSAAAVFESCYLDAQIPGGLDSSLGSISFWFTSNSTITAGRDVAKFGRCYIEVDTTGKLFVITTDSTATKNFIFSTQSVALNGHYAIEWDTSPGVGLKIGRIFYNGASLPLTITDTATGFASQYQFGANIGSRASGAFPLYGDLGEFMFWPGVFANWTVNIGKVYSAGNPVNPGPTGALPTGVVPKVYLSVRGSDLANTFSTNRGDGPVFTRVGSVLLRAVEAILRCVH